jgi:drug/metabolite transporter (DMT)-like permease
MIYFIYSLLCLIWGSTWLAIKLGLQDSPPLWGAGLRFSIAGMIFLFISLLSKAKYPKSLKEYGRLAIPGISMYALSYIFVYEAEVVIDSSMMAVLFASFPFWVALFSRQMLKGEKLSARGWLGLFIGFAGILFVFYDSLLVSQYTFWGAVMAVAGAAVSSYGTVYVRAYQKEYDITAMATVQIAVGTIVILLAASIFEPFSKFQITPKSIGALLYLALFGTVIGFWGYYWLLKKISAIAVSQITFITPIMAIFWGHLILSEDLSFRAIIGSLLILFGVILVLKE